MNFEQAFIEELEKLSGIPKGLLYGPVSSSNREQLLARADSGYSGAYGVSRLSAHLNGKASGLMRAGGGYPKNRLSDANKTTNLGRQFGDYNRRLLGHSAAIASLGNPTADLDRRISSRKPGSFAIRRPYAAKARQFSKIAQGQFRPPPDPKKGPIKLPVVQPPKPTPIKDPGITIAPKPVKWPLKK